MEFACKTDPERRLLEHILKARSKSAHKRDQRRWRRFAMLLAAVYFASFYLHTDEPIIIVAGIIISLGCAYGAGLEEFGQIVPAANSEDATENS